MQILPLKMFLNNKILAVITIAVSILTGRENYLIHSAARLSHNGLSFSYYTLS